MVAGSISLVGFGLDSFVEVMSGSSLPWRMSVDADVHSRERNQKLALRIVGICFLSLAVYFAYESSIDLLAKRAPEHSLPGIILACISLIVMPLLSRAKESVGRAMGSAAMHADAKQAEFCTLCLPKTPSVENAFEISDIQEEQAETGPKSGSGK